MQLDIHVTVHRDKFLIIKPTRCTNFSNLFLEWNSTCFGQFLCLSSGVFHCTHSNGICHTGLLTACEQEHLPLLASCQKHVEFHSKNKLEKLVHLVGFNVRNKCSSSYVFSRSVVKYSFTIPSTCGHCFNHCATQIPTFASLYPFEMQIKDCLLLHRKKIYNICTNRGPLCDSP